jgi:hypothetical protein
MRCELSIAGGVTVQLSVQPTSLFVDEDSRTKKKANPLKIPFFEDYSSVSSFQNKNNSKNNLLFRLLSSSSSALQLELLTTNRIQKL